MTPRSNRTSLARKVWRERGRETHTPEGPAAPAAGADGRRAPHVRGAPGERPARRRGRAPEVPECDPAAVRAALAASGERPPAPLLARAVVRRLPRGAAGPAWTGRGRLV